MSLFDMPLDQLETYRPSRTEPEDFEAFWESTLAESRKFPLETRFEPVSANLKLVEVFDVTYSGFGGQPIKGWFILPKQRTDPLPVVVEYIGYGGGGGPPSALRPWGNAAFRRFLLGKPAPVSALGASPTLD